MERRGTGYGDTNCTEANMPIARFVNIATSILFPNKQVRANIER
jgi:hypothetical protein